MVRLRPCSGCKQQNKFFYLVFLKGIINLMYLFLKLLVVSCNPLSFSVFKVMLQVLYKLKTAKVFERARGKEEKPSTDIVDEDPFAIQTLFWCPESRMLCVAGVSAHVIIYRFSKQEATTEVVQVDA